LFGKQICKTVCDKISKSQQNRIKFWRINLSIIFVIQQNFTKILKLRKLLIGLLKF